MSKLFVKNVKIKSAFLKGFLAPFASFRLMRKNKSILLFYIVPFLLNIILLSLLIYLALSITHPLLKGYLEEFAKTAGDGWFMSILIRILTFLIIPVLALLLLYFATLVYGFVGNILCSPFLDTLSQKTQEIVSGKKINNSYPLKQFPKRFKDNLARTFTNFYKMLALMLAIYLLSLFLLLIPLAGPILYTAIGFITTSFILGLQFMDYPLERRQYTFGEKLKIAWKFKYSTIGLGASFLIVSMIPVLGFLGINMCVMGASTIYERNIASALLEHDANES